MCIIHCSKGYFNTQFNVMDHICRAALGHAGQPLSTHAANIQTRPHNTGIASELILGGYLLFNNNLSRPPFQFPQETANAVEI